MTKNSQTPDLTITLDHAVIEAALTGRNMMLECGPLPQGYSHSKEHLIKEARRGLPQGASTSPITARICLAGLEMEDVHLEHTFNFEDDFFVMAKTEAELQKKIEALKAAVGNRPGGQFELVLKNAVHLSDGLDFLGHHIFLRKGKSYAEPSEKNLTRLTTHLHQLDADAFSNSSGKIVKNKILEVSANKLWLLRSWTAAFVACTKETKNWKYVECLFTDIFADLALHGFSQADLVPPTDTSKARISKFHYYKWFD